MLKTVKSLGIKDRLLLGKILPEEGNLITLKIIRNLKMELSFTDEEIKEFNLRIEKGSYLWDEEKEQPKEIEFGEKGLELVVETLKTLESQKKLPLSYIDLYEDFVGGI